MNKRLITITAILIIATLGNGCKSDVVTEKSAPKETYFNAMKHIQEAKFFHIREKYERKDVSGELISEETQVDYLAPDKIRLVKTRKNYISEVLFIGSDSYYA